MSMAQDRDALLRLGELLKAETGISLGGLRPELVQARLSRRMQALGVRELADYVSHLERGRKEEIQFFINLMTTNHTYFFREKPHLDFLMSVFLPRFLATNPQNLTIWCAACATGEEVYTLAMLVHRFFARARVKIAVSIVGTDINTEALRIAANGVYPGRRLQSVPQDFRRDYLQQGKFPHDKYFRIVDDLRNMVRFAPGNLVAPVKVFQSFDLILCRNVMIYFEPSTTRQVVRFLRSTLKDEGILISGLSEKIDHLDPRLVLLGRSIHAGTPDSRYRHATWECLPLEQVSSAGTLQKPSIEKALLERSPAKFWPEASTGHSKLPQVARHSFSSAPAHANAPVSTRPFVGLQAKSSSVVIAIGVSTGGQEAMGQVLAELSPPFPPIVVAQHIAAGYSKGYVETLRRLTQLQIKEVQDGEHLQDAWVYVAPGGHHLQVIRRKGFSTLTASVRPDDGSKLFVPSADLLFRSLAELDDVEVLAAILTGMGDDGTAGAKVLAAKGHWVVAQDRATSLVYGMPGSAVRAGAVAIELPLRAIGGVLAARARQALARKGAA